MGMVETGYDRPSIDPLRGLAYVTFQELATRFAHRNTGRYSQDPVADRIMLRISRTRTSMRCSTGTSWPRPSRSSRPRP